MENFLSICKDICMRMLIVEIVLFIVLSSIVSILNLKDKRKENKNV